MRVYLTGQRIAVPTAIRGLPLVVAISGGKDSTALALALRDAGLSYRMVFADTGWEAPETYAHLDYLREKLGPIETLRATAGMAAMVKKNRRFPSRVQRWCTRDLKIRPLQALMSKYDDAVNVVGIRAAESAARARLKVLEDDDAWGGWVWRPLLGWSVEDVLRVHRRHGVAMNPLYHRGHDRVGCYPCIYSSKGDLRLVAEYAPRRIAEIRELEADVGAAYFQIGPIDHAVAWSNTAHGGVREATAAPPGGCFRWGMCEPPSNDEPPAVPWSATTRERSGDLTEAEVAEIRARWLTGGVTQAALAAEYGVNQSQISRRVRRGLP